MCYWTLLEMKPQAPNCETSDCVAGTNQTVGFVRHPKPKDQRISTKVNPKRATPRYIVIKLSKVKDKDGILKAVKEKQLVTYKVTSIRLSVDFSAETLQVKWEWHDTFKVWKDKQTNNINQEYFTWHSYPS